MVKLFSDEIVDEAKNLEVLFDVDEPKNIEVEVDGSKNLEGDVIKIDGVVQLFMVGEHNAIEG